MSVDLDDLKAGKTIIRDGCYMLELLPSLYWHRACSRENDVLSKPQYQKNLRLRGYAPKTMTIDGVVVRVWVRPLKKGA